MKLKILILALVAVFLGATPALAAEKLQLGSPIKGHPVFYLPVLAAEEKGFWKEADLEVQWAPMNSSTELSKALVAGVLKAAISNSMVHVRAKARGAPLIAVAFLQRWGSFKIWVSGPSALKQPADLKGKKLEVTTLGGTTHAYGRLVVEALGLEKDVKFIGLGTVPTGLAALKAGQVDATIKSDFMMIGLKEREEVRELVDIGTFLPKEWSEQVVLVREDYRKEKPEAVRGLVKAIIRAGNYIAQDRAWSIEKMKALSGYSDEGASYIYSILQFSPTGRFDPKGFENVTNFMVKYGLLSPEEALPPERVFTNEFLPRG